MGGVVDDGLLGDAHLSRGSEPRPGVAVAIELRRFVFAKSTSENRPTLNLVTNVFQELAAKVGATQRKPITPGRRLIDGCATSVVSTVVVGRAIRQRVNGRKRTRSGARQALVVRRVFT